MKCKSFEELIALYVGGDHPGQMTREIEEHLKGCTSCRKLAGELRRGLGTLKELSYESVDPSTLQEIRKQVLGRIPSETPRFSLDWFRFSPFWKWNYALVAILVVTILAVALFRQNLFRGSRQEMANTPGKEVVLPGAPKETPTPAPSRERGIQGTQRAGLNESPVPRPRSNHRVKSVGQTERPTQSRPGPIVSPSFEISQIVPPHIEPFKIEFPKKADPLVVKWVTQDPDIEIIWLVDTKGE
jgi:putative zinc finger protein